MTVARSIPIHHRPTSDPKLRDYRNHRPAVTLYPMPDSPTPVLLLCRDLLFTSKVPATARAIAIPLQVVRDPAQPPPQGQRLIVDLNQTGALEAAAAWKAATAGHVTGFAS